MATDASMNICTNTAYLNLVDQRRRFQLYNIPPNRYNNLANNPYQYTTGPDGNPVLIYTKFDLDMRRKSEILKYSSNRMSTQTNNLTKSQKFAQAVNGSYQQRTYSQQFLNANNVNGVVQLCPPGVIIKTPSSASGVPGNLLLYDDPAVPLYNLINDTQTPYAIINQVSDPYGSGFKYSNKNDINNVYPENSTIFTLYLFNVSTPQYFLSFSTSISLNFYSSYLNGVTTPASGINSFILTVNHINLQIMYSHSVLPLSISPIGLFANNTSLNVTDINGSLFNGTCFFDSVSFSNIPIPVALGYIYDIQLGIEYNITPSQAYAQNYNSPTITTYWNATLPSSPITTQCRIVYSPSSPILPTQPVTVTCGPSAV